MKCAGDIKMETNMSCSVNDYDFWSLLISFYPAEIILDVMNNDSLHIYDYTEFCYFKQHQAICVADNEKNCLWTVQMI